MSSYIDAATAEKSGWISDNTGKRWFWNTGTQAEDQVADCPDGMAVTHLECSGKCCDNLRIHGAKPLQWVVDMTEDPVVTTWFSEEQRRMDCQEGKVVVGVECQASKRGSGACEDVVSTVTTSACAVEASALRWQVLQCLASWVLFRCLSPRKPPRPRAVHGGRAPVTLQAVLGTCFPAPVFPARNVGCSLASFVLLLAVVCSTC